MIIGVVTARISIPEAKSLKHKRSVVKGLKDRIRNRINVSAAEVGSQDVWKTAELAFVTVAGDSTITQSRVAKIGSFLRSDPRWILIDLHTTIM